MALFLRVRNAGPARLPNRRPRKAGNPTPSAAGSMTSVRTRRSWITRTTRPAGSRVTSGRSRGSSSRGSLDSYEGVGEGLYRRVSVTTRSGREAWLYVYGRALPPTAIGPIDRWNSTKRVRFFSRPANPQGGP